MPTRAEINFITLWRACAKRGCLDSRAGLKWEQASDTRNVQSGADLAGWTEFVTDKGPELTALDRLAGKRRPLGHRVLTPAGEDLIRTADAIDFDPATALADDEPEPAPDEPACSECGDSGEVVVIGSFKNPCACCGFGDVDARVRTALGEHRSARLRSPLVFGVDLASEDSSTLSHYQGLGPFPEGRERDALLRSLRKHAKVTYFIDPPFGNPGYRAASNVGTHPDVHVATTPSTSQEITDGEALALAAGKTLALRA